MKTNNSNTNGQKVQTLNGKQFEAMMPNLSQHSGLILVYTGSTGTKTALRFFGNDFTPKDGGQNEAFRCWKNIYTVFRTVKAKEVELREHINAYPHLYPKSVGSFFVIPTEPDAFTPVTPNGTLRRRGIYTAFIR